MSFHGGGSAAALIQYNRAYVAGTVWTWQLNRTARQDQHARLQFLESLGYPVFYAFPHFATPSELVALRRRLLVNTSWYPPSFLNPPGGPCGYHEVTFDVSTGRWQISSPEGMDLRPPLTISDVIHAMGGCGLRLAFGSFRRLAGPSNHADCETTGCLVVYTATRRSSFLRAVNRFTKAHRANSRLRFLRMPR